jgi:hypothetical protein
MADADIPYLNLRPYAREALWYPVTAHRELFHAWLFYKNITELDDAHQRRLYYAANLDLFPVDIELNSNDEWELFEQMGIDPRNSFCGHADKVHPGLRLAFVADIDLLAIGARLRPPPPDMDLTWLRVPVLSKIVQQLRWGRLFASRRRRRLLRRNK